MGESKKPNHETPPSPPPVSIPVEENSDNHNQTPDFRSKIRLKYVKLGYHYLISNAVYLIITPLLLAASANLSTSHIHAVIHLCNYQLKYNVFITVACTSIMAILTTLYYATRPRKIYLVDFACYKPDESLTVTRDMVWEKVSVLLSKDSADFTKKVLERSGLGDRTYASGLSDFPPKRLFESARKEAEMIIIGAIDDLFEKTKVKARDIGILIVNISAYNPTPSLSSMIVNRYKLRGDVISCNLGGMGCSAGVISIDLAKRLLQVQPNTYALVMSLESMTHQYYTGNDRSKLLTNCLFRMGGAAVLLSNKSSDLRRAKYELTHTLRTHKGGDDKAYTCVTQEEDVEGKLGITLSKDLMGVAGQALQANITTLGPLVLPMSEQLLFFATLVARKVFKMKVKPYVPDFSLAFEHFCIHTGGRGVLDELEKNLQLTKWHMEPSRMSLYRFGNTSSSSLWYVLAYSEAKGRIKKGDRVWQIAFGSGFKCNSAVWKAVKNVDPVKEKINPWAGEIDQFPVDIPKISPLRS